MWPVPNTGAGHRLVRRAVYQCVPTLVGSLAVVEDGVAALDVADGVVAAFREIDRPGAVSRLSATRLRSMRSLRTWAPGREELGTGPEQVRQDFFRSP